MAPFRIRWIACGTPLGTPCEGEERTSILNYRMFTEALDPVAKRLILMRGLRSIGQGAMVVDLTLYLKDLHWVGTAIGGVTSAAGLVGAALILVVGVLSDRMGRRPFLLIYEFMTLLAAILACFTTSAIFLIIAIVVAGFGRGQSGAAGPFSPAEQAWLARHVPRRARGSVFSLNNAVGFVGMALGSVLGGIPSLIHAGQPIVSYRPVFILVALISWTCITILFRLSESSVVSEVHTQEDDSSVVQPEHSATERTSKALRLDDAPIRSEENRAMLKLALVNTLNGLAVGLTGPMIAYWFSIRYGVSTAMIGLTLSVGFLMTGFASIFSGMLAQRIGMVKSVTWMRLVGSTMLLALPFMPNFLFASVLYVIRGAITRGTMGNRSALSASLTRDQRRGLATSVNAVSMRLPASIGPTITGYLFDLGFLGLPLILTASLQIANAGIYQWVFRDYDRKSED
jgi:MFS family permease